MLVKDGQIDISALFESRACLLAYDIKEIRDALDSQDANWIYNS